MTLIEEEQARAGWLFQTQVSFLPHHVITKAWWDTWRWVAGIGNLRKVNWNLCLIEMRPKRLTMKSPSLSLKAYLNRSYSYFLKKFYRNIVYLQCCVSGVQHSESVMHTLSFFKILFHRPSQILTRVPCVTCVCMLSHSVVSNTLVTPQTVARQAPLSMGFSRQEYWSGLPFPPPGDLPNPGIKPMSSTSTALVGGFFTTEPPCYTAGPY